ncbi:MAG: R3H domain-containing nucleic acid-binding protein [Candidatus Paceibacterota bacterium]
MQKIKDRILRIFDFYGIEGSEIDFEEVKQDEKIYLNILISDDQAKHFIGTRGETLDALELLTRLAHLDELSEGEKLIIDINGYRKEKEEKLRERAIRAAQTVIETGREYIFSDLNSYERYLVHSSIGENQELGQVETFSEDDAYGRVLIIKLKV